MKAKASAATSEPEKEKPAETKAEDSLGANAQPSTVDSKRSKKPVYSSEFLLRVNLALGLLRIEDGGTELTD